MGISISQLRSNIYRLLDQVLETGVPLEIERNGGVLRIVPGKGKRKRLNRLPRRKNAFRGDPGALVHIDWSNEWKP
jgi:antitoxin (DNA-binding transcriptional repressor) of toxin-antitoxin stability system